MPKITPALPDAHARHHIPDDQLAGGWCPSCYAEGAFTLSVDLDGHGCTVHRGLDDGVPAADPLGIAAPLVGTGGPQDRSRAPRGRAARSPAPPGRPRVRARTIRRADDRRSARAMAYGRRRAAARLARPGYTPHPAWRHLIAAEYRVLTDQAEALRIVQAAVDDQDWRADKRAAWLAILRQLVHAMDWDTGLVAACTAQRLGTAGARAPRTVSRVIAWAREVGLLVVVEHGASAEFLGTDYGRTPTYALVTDAPLPHLRPVEQPRHRACG